MRRLIVLLCAVVVTVGMSLPRLLHATPVYAVNDCNAMQGDEQVYERGDLYRSSRYWVWDSADPTAPGHWIDIDQRVYQVSHAGQCWRGYYWGVWSEDASWFYVIPRGRAWVCGGGPWAFDTTASFYAWAFNTTQGGWGPSAWVTYNVQVPTGSIVGVTFAPYGSWRDGSLCGAQADSYNSFAQLNTWYNPSYLQSLPGGCNCWYVNV